MPQELNGIVVFDTNEASQRLRRKPRTIQKWCREGKLVATKYGNEYLIPKTELELFVKKVFDTTPEKALS